MSDDDDGSMADDDGSMTTVLDLLIPSMVAMHLYKPVFLTIVDIVIFLPVNISVGAIVRLCCSNTTLMSASR